MPMEDLIASLADRIRAFEKGDPTAVLDDQALAEAADLWQQAAADDGIPVDVAQVVAWLHWYRSMVLPEDQDQEELQTALKVFAAIVEVAPDLVPEQVKTYLAGGTGNRTSPDAQAQQATKILQRVLAFDDPEALNHAIHLLPRPRGRSVRAGRHRHTGRAPQPARPPV
jgi:hypothetical protein